MTVLLMLIAYALALTLALARAGVRPRAVPAEVARPRRRPARILVVGATGGTGRALVTQALERGFDVTAFVRDRTRLAIDHPRLTVAEGDVLDPGTVAAAMRGQDAVVCALGHKRYLYPTRILSDGTRNILAAMETHAVRRLVCETSLGIGDSAGRLGLFYTFGIIPFVLPFYFWDKTRQERAIAASGVEWVIVRPGVLTQAAPRGRYQRGRHVGSFFTTVRIARSDVAHFMLDQLESDTYLHRAPGVAW
jgi:uncharacterized protein YbjT (DUF2867 family)